MHSARLSPSALAFAFALSASAAAPELEISARNATPLAAEGGLLIFGVELAARNSGAPLTVRSIDYTVAIEGQRFFSGVTQQFAVDSSSEKSVPVAGFEAGEAEERILSALRGTQQFRFQITGTVHVQAGQGALVDVRFSTAGYAHTPPEISSAPERRKGQSSYSLLSY
jgi:hypothetical protein